MKEYLMNQKKSKKSEIKETSQAGYYLGQKYLCSFSDSIYKVIGFTEDGLPITKCLSRGDSLKKQSKTRR